MENISRYQFDTNLQISYKSTNIMLNNFFQKIQDYINKKSNFLIWLFVVLVADYMLLFVLESILPGFVVGVFNINYLLFAILLLWVVMALSFKEGENQAIGVGSKLINLALIGLIGLVVVGLFFTLYKAGYWEIAIYILLAFVAGKLLYDHVKQAV